jgi:hypothetical protein
LSAAALKADLKLQGITKAMFSGMAVRQYLNQRDAARLAA